MPVALASAFTGSVPSTQWTWRSHAGEVLAGIGETGAGQIRPDENPRRHWRTPDSGQITHDGESVIIDSPRRATVHGIALIHQELNFCANVSVAGNLYLQPRAA